MDLYKSFYLDCELFDITWLRVLIIFSEFLKDKEIWKRPEKTVTSNGERLFYLTKLLYDPKCWFRLQVVPWDLITPDRNMMLHIIYYDTTFGAAMFIDDGKSTTLWKIFMYVLAALFIGFPDVLAYDQG